jgi:hypothetical protein
MTGAVILVSILLISSFTMSVYASQAAHNKNTLYSNKVVEQKTRPSTEEHSSKNTMRNLFTLTTPIDLSDLLTSTIQTSCSGLEKSSDIVFGITNDLDVDGDETNGINGKDIRVQYYILPWLEIDTDPLIGLEFSINIQRIGEEIKSNDFNLTATLGKDILSVGYWSPQAIGNEIPTNIQLSLRIFLNIADGSKGVTVSMTPTYSSDIQNKKLVFFSSYHLEDENTQHNNYFTFDPPTKTDITITSTRNPGEWNYELTRTTDYNTIVTMALRKTTSSETKETIITFDRFPRTISFSLMLTPFSSEGGSVYYASESMYETNVQIQTDELGTCKYAIIKNTPRMLFAEWKPVKENGWYHLEIDSDGTDIHILDSLDEPTIDLSIFGVTDVDMTAFWNFTDPGDLRIIKNPSFHINLSFIIGVWVAKLDAQPVAEDIHISWLTDITGYLSYDTNWQSLNQMDLLIHGSDAGIRTVAETFKAEDFRLDWTVWPPSEWNVNTTGNIDFNSMLIEVYIQGQWYHLWPWS